MANCNVEAMGARQVSKLLAIDPMAMNQLLWPESVFYDKQIEIIYSVELNSETYVVAGNQLGA